MRRGERPPLLFIVSQQLTQKSFEARFFLGASENENVCNLALNSDGWKDLKIEKQAFWGSSTRGVNK